MDLNLVQIFVRVAETRSFSAAARAIGLPTSSVSRAVARLEREIGTKLLERTTRRTSLTAPGRAYFDQAVRALAELSEGERLVGELMGDARGEVKLTVSTNLDDGFLAAQLAAFARAHPRIRLTAVLTNRKVDIVEEGFDLALRVEQKTPDPSFVARYLGEFHAWLVASRDYLARRGHPTRVVDLADHDCIAMRTRGGVSRWPLVGPNGPELVDVRGPIAADDIRFALQLAIAGAGIGTLIFAPGTRTSLRPPLVRVLPEYIVQGPKLFVVTPPARRLPLGVALLRDFLVRAYGSATPAGAVPNEQPRQQRHGSERESRQRTRGFGTRKKRA